MLNTGKETCFLAILAFLLVASCCYTSGETVWPLPKQITVSGLPYPVSSALSIKTTSKSNILEHGITRYLKYITTQLLSDERKDFSTVNDKELDLVVVNVTNDSETLGMETSYMYTISFNSSNTIQINAQSPFGALYGLETLSQLIEYGALVNRVIDIKDEPSFIHRGLMLDTGRRFFPLELLYNILDAMSFVKLNVLHFHLSDFCRFSVESKLYPDLRNKEQEIYSQEDIQNLVNYARDRGIRVIPEVESAGHANGLVGLYNKTKGLKFCNTSAGMLQLYNDPQGVTIATMKGILSEMMTLFPDELFHLGLDETFTDASCTSDNVKSLETTLLKHVALKKTTVAWEEALSVTDAILNSTVVQAWKSESIKEIVDKKLRAINALSSHFYLNEPNVTPTLLWTNISSGLNPDEIKFLLGGEMAMWTDDYCFISECFNKERGKPQAWWMYDPTHDSQFTQSVSGLIWPIASVGAGSFWNYNPNLKPETAEFVLRYDATNRRLLERGILSCPLRPCKCDYLTRCSKPYPQ